MLTDDSYSILLDSNAIGALSLYFELCKHLSIEFDDGNWQNIKAQMEALRLNDDFAEEHTIKRGYIIWTYLKQKQSKHHDKLHIYISLFADLEFRDILLNQAFDHYLSTKGGFPYRSLRKRPLRRQLEFNYKDKVAIPCKILYENLRQNFICEQPEMEGGFIEKVCDYLMTLSQHVFFDIMDAYFYCVAVSLFVDEIISSDGEFCSIINKMRTDEEWHSLRDKFINDIASKDDAFKLGLEGKSFKDVLPKGIKPEQKILVLD